MNGLDPSPVVCSWTVYTQDLDGRTTFITFDLFKDSSPLIIGLELTRYASTDFIACPPTITFRRPTDKEPRRLPIYIRSTSVIDSRAHVDLLLGTTHALLASGSPMRPLSLAKRIHRFTHAPASDVTRMLRRAGCSDPKLERAVSAVSGECVPCAQSGPPLPMKKLSLSRVDAAFNEQVQADYTFVTIRQTKYCVLHAVDTSTSYSETVAVSSRSAQVMAAELEKIWIYRHGAPRTFASDFEFQSNAMKLFLSAHDIELRERPVRRHNKTGVVERKNLTLKRILERLQLDKCSANDSTILARATFLSNIFSGSRLLSSFELVRGYTPSVLGLPKSSVTPELLEAYKEQVATRALQRLLSVRAPSTIPPADLEPGTEVFYFYKSSKQSEPVEWRPGVVISAETHLVRLRTPSGKTSSVAYEDLRLRPSSELSRYLMEGDADIAQAEGGECITDQVLQPSLPSILPPREDTQHDQSDPLATGVESLDNTTALLACSDAQPVPDELPPSPLDLAARDIGSHAHALGSDADISGLTLQSDLQHALQDIRNQIGTKQVSASQLSFAPGWVLEQALEKEMRENWLGAYEIVDEQSVPREANKIGCHAVYKIKDATIAGGKETLVMKARNVLHGNRDKDRYTVRRDSSSADLAVVRLVISLGVMLGFSFGTADVKGAYMQSGPAKRDIFVRPPKEFKQRGKMWRLLRLPYGIVEAGRQWLCAVEDWMLEKYNMQRVFGVDQLFARRRPDGNIVLLVAKVVDDFFMAGDLLEINHFSEHIDAAFKLGATSVDLHLKFLGCDINILDDGSVDLSMADYLDRIRPIQVSRERRSGPHDLVNDRERSEYRSLAGTLLYLGQAVLPQACLVASKIQQRLGMLKVAHLVDANEMLAELHKLKPRLVYRNPGNITNVIISTLSDASHGASDEIYGQSGVLCGLKITNATNSAPFFHAVSWTSHKQRRVTYSSFGAEILAAASGDDRGFDFKMSLSSLFPQKPVKHQLLIDSKALFETITTLHQTDDYRLRKTVARIRASFESQELNVVHWIPGTENYADVLTKRNLPLSKRLNDLLNCGIWDVREVRGAALDSETWV